MDESFAFFLENFGGAPLGRREVDPRCATRYDGRLPTKLFDYWSEHGFAGYGSGRFWTTDPADYEAVLKRWLKHTAFAEADDYHVIGRTAFGGLWVWGSRSGPSLQIASALHLLFPDRMAAASMANGDANFVLQIFFESMTPAATEIFDDVHAQPLFKRALRKLGPLAADEVYGFVPALVMGGRARLDNLRKLRIIEHLEMLAELAPARIMENPLRR